MADGAVNGVRVILLLLGAGAVAGSYAIWQGNQPDVSAPVAGAVADAPVAEAMASAPAEPAPAIAEPAVPDVAATDLVAPEAAVAEDLTPEPPPPAAPTFDVVRIEAGGAALIAGTAPADARVSLLLDGVEELRVQAGGDGAFVAQFTLPPNPAPRLLTMVAVLADGTEIAGDDTVAVAPVAAVVPEAAEEPAAPPAAILLTDEGAEVIQGPMAVVPPEAEVLDTTAVTLDTIAYAPDGAVQLSGRGQGEEALRIYLDNTAVMDAAIGGDGKWSVTLPTTAPGIYTLRIDQMGADGNVSSRFETPFKRETLDALAAASGAVVPAPEVIAEAEPEVVPEVVAEEALPEKEVEAVPEVVAEAAVAEEVVVEAAPEVVAEEAVLDEMVVEAVPEVVTEEAVAEEVVAAEPEVVAAPVPADPVIAPVVAEPVNAPVTVTVQPGFTLWGIATERFGEGTMYVQVFEANRASIKNPDLIYPGQVFTLPQE